MNERTCTKNDPFTVIFWNRFNSTLLFVVFTVLSSKVVLTQNGKVLSCATIAFSERYDPRIQKSFWGK